MLVGAESGHTCIACLDTPIQILAARPSDPLEYREMAIAVAADVCHKRGGLRRAGRARRRSYSGTEPTRPSTWPACGHCKRASAPGGGGSRLEGPADPPHHSARRSSPTV